MIKIFISKYVLLKLTMIENSYSMINYLTIILQFSNKHIINVFLKVWFVDQKNSKFNHQRLNRKCV